MRGCPRIRNEPIPDQQAETQERRRPMSEEKKSEREEARHDDESRPPRKRSEFERFTVVMLAVIAVLLGGYLWVDSQRLPPKPEVVQAPAPEPPPPPPVVVPPPAPKPVPVPAPAPEPPPVVVVPPPTPAPEPEPAPEPSPFLDAEPPKVAGLQTTAELESQAELLANAISSARWSEYVGLLDQGLADALGDVDETKVVSRFGDLWKDPLFRQALLRRETIGRFSEDHLRRLAQKSDGPETIEWILNSDEVMVEILLTLRADDDPKSLLTMLHTAWQEGLETAEKYHALAIACGVVFDRPIRIQHDNDSSENDTGPAEIDAVSRFRWYVKQNEAGKLVVSIDRSTASDLCWVVCAPVPVSELEWAVRKLSFSRRGWGGAYSEVEYLMEKAVEGENPYDAYTFEEILDKGGICGDQSYFCANTARANGIPAAILSGETNSGAHAWCSLKTQPDEWDTGVGRIDGVSIGRTTDPRNGETVTEQHFWLWNERDHQRRSTVLAVHSHLWLADLFAKAGQEDAYAAAVRHANRIGEKFPVTWSALFDLMTAETVKAPDRGADSVVDAWKEFVEALRREFRDHPRMAGLAERAENVHIFPFAELDYARSAMRRQRRVIEREAGEQADLLADSLRREAKLVLEREPDAALEDISRLYDSALRDYGESVTAFKQMAEDYFSFTQHDPEAGKKAVRDIELAFRRTIETGSKEWFRANTEADIYRMICGYYRAVGDEKRAEMLEKRLERQVERAKRGAL
jgi:hypothetical protein